MVKMVKEVVILAGGLGTRLRPVIKDMPKPMAKVAGKPFLIYLLEYLNRYDFRKAILSVGYKGETVRDFFGEKYKNILLEYAVEQEPLGTGGGVKNALNYANGDEVLLLNGDTFFNIDLNLFYKMHNEKLSHLSIALKEKAYAERYGAVEIDENNKIIAFLEKKQRYNIFINGGIYLLNKSYFDSLSLSDKFSFENDFLEKYYKSYDFYGFPFEEFFIDIGVPEDYERANKEFERFKHN